MRTGSVKIVACRMASSVRNSAIACASPSTMPYQLASHRARLRDALLRAGVPAR
jgi:hypothetical protein